MQIYDVVIWVLVLFLMLAIRVKIAISLGMVGIIGLLLAGRADLLGVLSTVAYNNIDSFVLTSVPLFVFMAGVVQHSGLGKRFYDAMSPWFLHIPGGLAQSNLVGCAVFAATMGSSLSVAATMGTIAIPEMKERGYHIRLITGPLAAGGTLGILIPPSLAMIVYGVATEQSVGKLFIAGVIPGIILALLFMATAVVIAKLHPDWVPRKEARVLRERILPSIGDSIPVIAIILIIVVGIYTGFMTPTESAAVGAFGTILIALAYRDLSWKVLKNALFSSISITCMILLLVIGAQFMSYALQITGAPMQIAKTLAGLSIPPMSVFAIIGIIYLIMGCFFDGLSMMLITIPLFYPIIVSLHLDPIWFAVEVVLFVEMGLLTPPVGLNLFVIQGVADCELSEVVKGTMPFWVAIILTIALLAAFPVLATWLPAHMR